MGNRKLLNVRSFIEWVETTTDFILKDNGRYTNGLVLPPVYEEELRKIRFFAGSILKKHTSKNTRKDIYVERR